MGDLLFEEVSHDSVRVMHASSRLYLGSASDQLSSSPTLVAAPDQALVWKLLEVGWCTEPCAHSLQSLINRYRDSCAGWPDEFKPVLIENGRVVHLPAPKPKASKQKSWKR